MTSLTHIYIASNSFSFIILDYKGNSSPVQTINIESDESNTNSKQTWARDTSNMSTNVTKNDNTTRDHPSSAEETDEHPYNDAIFRIGKVKQV